MIATADPGYDLDVFLGLSFVLIEDDELVRSSTELLLTRTGASVYAVQYIQDYQNELSRVDPTPDLYLVDYALTDSINGLDVIKHIQSIHQDARFLLYSGDLISADLLSGVRRSEFIRKPFEAGALISKIQKLLIDVDVLEGRATKST